MRMLQDEDRIPVRFRGHFPACKLAITVANNIQDKISRNHQYGGKASIPPTISQEGLKDQGGKKK
eukprot:6597350-Ditylum_brightwellii.AAC.1